MLKLLSQTIISDEYVVGSYTTNAGLDKEYKFPMMEDYIGDVRRFIDIVLDPFPCYGKVHMFAYRYFDHVAIQRGWTYETTSQVNVSQDQRKDKAMYESGKLYCKIPIRHKYNMLEKNMLRCIGKKHWAHGFALQRFDTLSKTNERTVKEMRCLLDKYKEVIEDENKVQQEDLCRLNVGRPDPKKRLEELLLTLYSFNTLQILGTMVNKIAF
ncbi:hypothetical protein QJS04_geneDACA015550 [Acorus gramineus]|uniref:26S proteasome regulatory subunit RPN11 C-terminal domain-containing protein n=1 Tax=Acorus gramineus TaxID=55184 RepID=A0AAV9ANY0_ACOGR|nr:hypothetical protein QJS04_geneDACA015550 [Acorus gramineus]